MSTLSMEAPVMSGQTDNLTRDMVWHVSSDKKMTVRNVPYSMMDTDGEEIISLDVSIKLELIRELILQEEVPQDVDFNDIADVEVSD
ncbi:hypothetical protein GCM10028778_17990 [Barrientosiimonas marina]|uniref:Uncharacterized protein n=1 Tax=Lentibacillus kimchii TaxID=1542911 RepID=A0ABW2UX90_9BACI